SFPRRGTGGGGGGVGAVRGARRALARQRRRGGRPAARRRGAGRGPRRGLAPAGRCRADSSRALRGDLTVTGPQAIVLGIVQGVTEFLPIPSTAHLRVVPAVLGWDDPGAAFTAVLQLGSLAAVISYFLADLLRMLRAALPALRDRRRATEPAARQLL